jgi:hypothetical protein
VEERNSEKKKTVSVINHMCILLSLKLTICTEHILGINALLVLLVSFIDGCLARDNHGRLYVYLGPRLQEAVEFDSDRRGSLT